MHCLYYRRSAYCRSTLTVSSDYCSNSKQKSIECTALQIQHEWVSPLLLQQRYQSIVISFINRVLPRDRVRKSMLSVTSTPYHHLAWSIHHGHLLNRVTCLLACSEDLVKRYSQRWWLWHSTSALYWQSKTSALLQEERWFELRLLLLLE